MLRWSCMLKLLLLHIALFVFYFTVAQKTLTTSLYGAITYWHSMVAKTCLTSYSSSQSFYFYTTFILLFAYDRFCWHLPEAVSVFLCMVIMWSLEKRLVVSVCGWDECLEMLSSGAELLSIDWCAIIAGITVLLWCACWEAREPIFVVGPLGTMPAWCVELSYHTGESWCNALFR